MQLHGLDDFPDPVHDDDDPRHWLGSTPLLDLDDPRMRLKARALTQLCKTPREQALAVYGFVKRLPVTKEVKVRFRTAREVIDAGTGDADDKATALMALLRAAGIPARLRYMELHGDMLRGLVPRFTRATRPVAEIWLGGRWLRTDTYIFDARFMAAARQRLKDRGWHQGYGIHVAGHSLWNGTDEAFLGGDPYDVDSHRARQFGPVSDPQELVDTPHWRATHRLIPRALLWNFVARRMGRVMRELREEAGRGVALPQGRSSW